MTSSQNIRSMAFAQCNGDSKICQQRDAISKGLGRHARQTNYREKVMEILLGPSTNGQRELARSYARAIKSSKELYIASAFLTNWGTHDRLCARCEKLLFLVGTDFGLTRKQACENVLRWLPKKLKSDFLAVPSTSAGSFHPKVIAWLGVDNRYHCIVGSSNLTEAAFNLNYEANIELDISRREYDQIVKWIEDIAKECQVINADWLDQYKERSFTRPKKVSSKKEGRVIQLSIPSGGKYDEAIVDRRKREKRFGEIDRKLLLAMRKCARGTMSNAAFWERFKDLWWYHPSRILGEGLQISAKHANWHQACKSMLHIVDLEKTESEISLDRVVQVELDLLAKAGNPVRGAWFSEILCHYLPHRYPVLAQPVKEWLKLKRWKAQQGSSEGSSYIELARKLREAIRQNEGGPRNLPELDAVIWTAVSN
jgi:hypothetical protein